MTRKIFDTHADAMEFMRANVFNSNGPPLIMASMESADDGKIIVVLQERKGG